ncbi:hypothetical protein F4555_001339 [Mobiluncus mulieris]|uniref:Uncharacterized protein n=1 Tax=Mobiluncus mulieris TaxID=2052 RepID=A0A8G2HVA4_9ACTO|nr:hypothetical protein [Mobiluncus mulieris]MBB5846543.1 hypothetical protein [Mobiluncus mulieris]MCV0011704.1 hypothetical protein [Mobiluncus mulieris]STO16981.1 Uncharacterised protein [Mobiluncus mulieris]
MTDEAPPIFKPGDILTADQINRWMVEAPEKDLATYHATVKPLIDGLEQKIKNASNPEASPALWIQNGGGPLAN